MNNLSLRQQQVLEFIKHYCQRNHHSPTRREIQKDLGINSFSFLDRILQKLESLGYIERAKDRTRHNIQLCQSPYALPLLGKIAAGAPIQAISDPQEIVITEKLLGDNRFLLEVKGDSMLEENICNGDWIVCERCETVPNGTIVVALVRREEATLKRFYLEKNRVRLEPANQYYRPQYYSPEDVIIQGRLVGLIRLNR